MAALRRPRPLALHRLRLVLAIRLRVGLGTVPLRALGIARAQRLALGAGHDVGTGLGRVAFVQFALRLVNSESDEQAVLEQDDPYLVQDDQLPLRDLVEDEVLLALPMLPRCPDPGCLERMTQGAGEAPGRRG